MKKQDIYREIENISRQVIERYHPVKVILFGSAARNDAEVHDIDLFIVKKDVPYYGSDRSSELYRLIETNAPVDYIVYKPEEAEERLTLGDPFIVKIFREGKVLYG